jgi:hypothetical protein
MNASPTTLEGASDHQVWELLKLQDAAAWRLAWERAVLPEAESFRSGRKAREWGITPEEMMSMLYVEMVGARKIELYRDDGGSLWGWMRMYVRGYVQRARPKGREVSIDATGAGGDEDGRGLEEKISKMVSDLRGRESLPDEDPAVRRREEWSLVQKCFGDLWRKNPVRAYVHLLKLRMNLSSAEIKGMLGMTSEANVDQAFSRALKDMRKLKVEHEERA